MGMLRGSEKELLKCWDLRGSKQQDAKESDIVRNFMVFVHHEIVLDL